MSIEMFQQIIQWLQGEYQWPQWATQTFFALTTILCAVHFLGQWMKSRNVSKAAVCDFSDDFLNFQRQYLIVYYLVMFADWLQGTHMYGLYESYGMDVRILFLTGFLSSTLFGHLLGPLIDQYGRRRACLIYCALEIVINALENIPNMPLLMLSRMLGGCSTCLLFSAFESWMVTEHRKRGFSEESLGTTFALASEGNGIVAVLAGLVAQVAADVWGEIGPFRLAILMTAVAACFIFRWSENYDVEKRVSCERDELGSHWWSVSTRRFSRSVVALGCCYSLFEGAMFTFVFLWYPTLSVAVVSGDTLPSGLIFSCFMLCTAIGGKSFDILRVLVSEENLARILCFAATLFFLIPKLSASFTFILAAFMWFEVIVGMFMPCAATLRSHHFPSAKMSSTLSTFRLPTNILVVLGTGATGVISVPNLFLACALVMMIAGFSAVQIEAESLADTRCTKKTE